MLQSHGAESRCMITGESTHNQRVDKLWRDVYEGVLSYYYDLFYYLEDQDHLEIMSNTHILAHYYCLCPKSMKGLKFGDRLGQSIE